MRIDYTIRTRVAFSFVRPFLATSALALAVTGCAQKSDEPTQQDYNDVASSVGALVAGGGGELASIEDSVGTATGEIPFGFSSNGSGQIEGTRGGMSFLYEVACTGADGVSMAVCDSTTDTASLLVEWAGNYEGDFWQFEISRTGEWSVSGLQGDVAVFSGEGTFDVSSALQSLDGQSFALVRAVLRRLVRHQLGHRRPARDRGRDLVRRARRASRRGPGRRGRRRVRHRRRDHVRRHRHRPPGARRQPLVQPRPHHRHRGWSLIARRVPGLHRHPVSR